MIVLAYQAFIAISILLTRLISPKHLHTVALGWTAFTIFNLFWPPLIVLQLGVIWGIVFMLPVRQESHAADRTTPIQRRDAPANNVAGTIEELKAVTISHDQHLRASPVRSAFNIKAESGKSTPIENPFDILTVSRPRIKSSDAQINSITSFSSLELDARLRGIERLVHFTRIENLPSIFERGLLSVDSLLSDSISAVRNDQSRMDKRLGAISVSLTHPNYKMFYKYREINKGSDWAVLVLDPSILWKKKCLFCMRNAADHRIRERPSADLTTLSAFTSMFAEIEGVMAREAQKLLPCDTTDPQAEVLVCEAIEPALIKEVVVQNPMYFFEAASTLGSARTRIVAPGKDVFATRPYVRKALYN